MTEPHEACDRRIAKLEAEIERLRGALSWITGACVDELPHAEISAAIDAALEPTND